MRSYHHGVALMALATVAGFAVYPASPVVAQEAPAAARPPAEETSTLDEVVVTAQRRTERLRDVPITLTALNAEQLTAVGVTNIRELSTVTPGLTYSGQGPFAQPNIRGVSTTLTQAGSDSPIAIYLDGLYQPNQMGNTFDLADVEQVEVLKGPQGTLFGRNATGGAITVRTRSPSFTREGSVEASAGLYGGGSARNSSHYTASGYVSGPLIADKLAGSVAGFFENTDGYLTNDVTGGRTGSIDAYVVRGKLLFEPRDGMSFLLSAFTADREDYAGTTLTPVTGVTVASQYPDAIIPTQPWHVASELKDSVNISKIESRGSSLRAIFDIGDYGVLTSITGYSYVNGTVGQDVDAAFAPSCVATFACLTPYIVDYGPSETWQQELTFASRDFGAWRFVGGLFFYRDDSGIGTAVNPPLVDGVPTGAAPFFTQAKVETDAYAAFGEATWSATDRLSVIAGLRYSWESKKGTGSMLGGPDTSFGGDPEWDAVTPRLSVRYALTSQANVYATYSEGFKSGVIDSLGLTADVAEPETLTAYEAGFKYSSGRNSFNLSAFHYKYEDLQVQFYLGLASKLGNAASATMSGLDIDGSYGLGDNFTLRGGASWVPKAEYETFTSGLAFALPMTPAGLQQVVVDASGDRLLKTPEFTGNVSLAYGAATTYGDVDASVTVFHSGAYDWDLLRRIRTDAYTTVSAQVGLTLQATGVRIGVYGKNLTNEAYAPSVTASGLGDTYNFAAPREVGLRIGYRF